MTTTYQWPDNISNDERELLVYCHTPESKVLTADLRWVEIETLSVGDQIVSFDENSSTRQRHRHFATGTVTTIQRQQMHRSRVVTSVGETRVTHDHPFLVRNDVTKPRTRWVRADKLKPGDQIYAVPMWEPDTTWESGYLAGQFDGDGCLVFIATTPQSGISQLSWAQKSGRPDIPFVEQLMSSRGFKTRTHGPGRSGCDAVHVAGTWFDQARFLGAIRPRRLLSNPNLSRLWEGRSLQVCDRAIVEQVIPMGDGEVVAMSVDTRTYIADGFLTYNSQHGLIGGRRG